MSERKGLEIALAEIDCSIHTQQVPRFSNKMGCFNSSKESITVFPIRLDLIPFFLGHGTILCGKSSKSPYVVHLINHGIGLSCVQG